MDPRIDEAKGRVKEAAGALTGNEELKAEGAREEADAQARQAVDAAAQKAKGVVADAAATVEDAIDSAKDHLT
jgi:uncharacterized protein YjbJ (UPF0337 family)